MQDGDGVRGQLKGVAVTARDEGVSAASFFLGHRGREKIIRLVAWRFGIGKPAGRDQFRQHLELIDQFVVELPSALIAGKQFLG